jgi:hypothetical protein
MANIVHKFDLGKPGAKLSKWPKDSMVQTEVVKTENNRYVARVKVNDHDFFSLPGTHPTEADAQRTLECYVEENMFELMLEQ